MAFFRSQKIVLAFLNNAELRLSVYQQAGGKMNRLSQEILDFAGAIVKDSSILDASAFSLQISEFFKTRPEIKKSKVLLVVPEEKIFLKGFELGLGDLEQKDKLRLDFLEGIPFSEDDLIIRGRQVGKVMEFSAIHKAFAADFQKPFIDLKMNIAGLISVPQAIALNLRPKDRSFLLAFYDNDFALALAENSCIIFSETHSMLKKTLKDALGAFDHFVQHLRAAGIKSVSVILGEDEIEDALKIELERRDYEIKEIKKMSILDMIADYYQSHEKEDRDWNMLYKEDGRTRAFFKKYKFILYIFLLISVLTVIGLGIWAFFPKFSEIFNLVETPKEIVSNNAAEIVIPAPVVEAPAVAQETPKPAEAKKSDFPIKILNGTKVAGEAGKLKSLLESKGFEITGTGNNEDQNQIVTTIFINTDMPEPIISELRLLLEARYQNILVSPSPVSDGVIHIVIGKKK